MKHVKFFCVVTLILVYQAFIAVAYYFTASGLSRAIIEEILEQYLGDLGASQVGIGGLGKADISDWINHGVPGASLETQKDTYFFFHHTEGN